MQLRGFTFASLHVFYLSHLRNIQGAGTRTVRYSRQAGEVHDIGLGGAVVVSFLRRSEFYKLGGADGRTRLVHIRDENSVIL